MTGGIIFMSQIQEEMGDLFPFDKTVRHDKYSDVKRTLDAWKDKVLKQFARDDEERAAVVAWWPFD